MIPSPPTLGHPSRVPPESVVASKLRREPVSPAGAPENPATALGTGGASRTDGRVRKVIVRREIDSAAPGAARAADDLESFLSEGQRIARMGNWSWNLVSGELRWSEQVFRIFGRDPDTFVPTSEAFWDALHPEDRPRLEDHARSVLERGGAYSSEYRILRPDGEERILHELGEVALGPDGRGERMAGTVQDVTEWRRAEESVRIKDAALDATITPVIMGDLRYRVFYANRAFLDHMGYREEEVLGRDGLALAQDAERVRGVLERVRREGSWRGELLGVTKGGERFEAEASFALVRGRRGEPLCYIASFTDISPYRRSQRLVREAAQDWQRTFDSIDSPVLVVCRNGKVRRSNRAAREYLRGEEPPDLAALGNVEPWLEARRMVGESLGQERSHNRQVEDGAGRTWDLSTTLASRAEGGGPTVEAGEARVMLVLRDITRLVELQRSLRRSEQMSAMGSLVAGVAHEVRNPLFGISATVDTLEQLMSEGAARRQLKEDLDGDVVECLEVLRGELDRMKVLMEDLLEYGRPVELELRPASVDTVLAKVLGICGRARRVRLQLEPPLPRVRMDSKRMAQVFANLVDNALEHQGSEPRLGAGQGASPVVVRCRAIAEQDRAWLECRVEDRGPGFPAEHLERLMEPFYSLRAGGTGLGLSIVQRIVEQHGGRVSLENRRRGGARVTVCLPCVSEGDELQGSGSGPGPGESGPIDQKEGKS